MGEGKVIEVLSKRDLNYISIVPELQYRPVPQIVSARQRAALLPPLLAVLDKDEVPYEVDEDNVIFVHPRFKAKVAQALKEFWKGQAPDKPSRETGLVMGEEGMPPRILPRLFGLPWEREK